MEFLRELCICPICKDTLDDPRMLPCAHSFCFSCILKHFVYKKYRGISCPICRLIYELPNHGDIEGLPVNIYVTAILEFFALKKDETDSMVDGDLLVKLGDIYNGDCYTNEEHAYKWYKRAADDGKHTKGYEFVGLVLYRRKKYEEALTYLQKGAEANNRLCQKTLGDMYRFGQGTSQDLDKAIQWYKMAIDAGDTSSIADLGHIS